MRRDKETITASVGVLVSFILIFINPINSGQWTQIEYDIFALKDFFNPIFFPFF